MTVGALNEPLLGTDVEAGLKGDHKQAAKERIQHVAPILPQLPTDILGPALQHCHSEMAVASGVSLSPQLTEKLSAMPVDTMEAVITTAWSALLGRYARAGEVAMSVYIKSSDKWAVMRVDTLLPENERPMEEEDSAVIPASAFAPARRVCETVAAQLDAILDGKALITHEELQALDVDLLATSGGNGPNHEGLTRSLETAIFFGGEPRGSGAKHRKHPLAVVVPSWPNGGKRAMPIEIRYARGVWSSKTAMRALNHLATLLEQFPDRLEEPLCKLDLQLATGCSALKTLQAGLNLGEVSDLQSWGDAYLSSCYCSKSEKYWSAERPITHLFDEMVKICPNNIALTDDGTGKSWTYHELSAIVDKVAAELVKKGVKADVLVPLMAARGAAMIFGMFGILRAGGAYVPMDLHWPDERLKDVLSQCNAPVVLGAEAVVPRLQGLASGAEVLCVEGIVNKPTNGGFVPPSRDRASGTSMVYVFFTSGTTGKPKGVMVEHRGLTHRIHWFQERFPLAYGEGVMQKVAYTFGLSEWEIFWPLSYGAALVLAPPGGEKDPDYVLRRASGSYKNPSDPSAGPDKTKLAAHVFVPSMLQMVLERWDELEEQEAARKHGKAGPEGTWWRNLPMRQVITCGEPLTAPLAQRMFARFTAAGLVNLYGPTEGEMTEWNAPRGESIGRVLAGSTMSGSKVILADLRDPKIAGSLEPAEIAFGGPFIARGYLGRPDLDAKAFIDDFSCTGEEDYKNARLYMTGDLGRWREGELELLGRRDFQVKLRGFRIELGEIESAIRAAGARAAVCVVRAGAGGAAALVAYYEPGVDGKVSEASVRSSCQKRLPPYMQPQAVVQMEKLPRNANGKVDRPKLPEPVIEAAPAGDADKAKGNVVPPDTPTEEAVVAAWSAVLGKPEGMISVEADFQELGGSSLLAGRATALIRKRLSIPGLAGTVIYKHPTVRRLAVVVDAALKEKAAEEAAAAKETTCQALAPAQLPIPDDTLSNGTPLAMFIQFCGIFSLNFIFETQAWSPIWWAAWFVYVDYGTWALIAYLPVAVVLDLIMQICVLTMFKWLVVGKLKPGKYKLWSMDYYRWWFINQLTHHVTGILFPLIAETPWMNTFLRMQGATIGKGVRISVSDITQPDLLICGDYVTIGKRVRISTATVMNGYLYLNTVKLGDGAAVGPCSVLSQQTEVPPDTAVLPLSTMPGWHGAVGCVAYQKATPFIDREFQRKQDLLRAVFGVPFVVLSHSIPYIPTVFVLQWFWSLCCYYFDDQAFTWFSIFIAWVYVHPLWLTFLAWAIFQKWCIIGQFKPGHMEWNHWAEFKHWLHARTVESHDFAGICEMWVNTEFLSVIYRLMGAKVGKRVQMDHFHAVEHDCISIGDYTVFGSEVFFSCDSRAPWTPTETSTNMGYEITNLGKAANVLDHATMLPGTLVAERAVLGTCTLAPHRSYFHPLAIYSGSNRGRPTHLRDHNAPEALRNLEDKAMRDLDDPVIWWRFNAIIAALTFVAKPIPEALWVITYFGVTAVWDPEEDGILALLAVTPIIYFMVCLIELFVTICAKWLVIGTYKAGEFPFFGQYHVRWMTMMILSSGISDLGEALQGSIFNEWLYRANGAKVGKNCYLSGLAVEYDLLQIGDNCAIGGECDTTGHTVENMVIKLAATKLGNNVTMCPASFAMPGSVLEDRCVLLEHTQVLKGETVPAGEVWAGMPAAMCNPKAPAA